MSILLKNIPLGLDEEEALLKGKAAAALQIGAGEILALKIIRKSLDLQYLFSNHIKIAFCMIYAFR